MNRLASSLTILAVALASTNAAADHAHALSAFQAAEREYKAKDFAAAATDYRTAYDAEPDPVYLFDIAQSDRLSDACDSAARYYRKFLAAVPNPPNLQKVKKFLEEVDACTAALKPTEPKEPKPAPEPEPTPTPAVEPTPEPSPHQPPLPRELVKTHPQRASGIALGAIGLASAVAGVYFTTRVGHWSSARESLCPGACTWSASLTDKANADDSAGQQASTFAIVGYSVGAAALVAGAALYFHTREVSVPVDVGFVPGGATLGLRASF
jgi:hypothetical protein